ncbi:MAG: hypothetical protein HY775_03075 [Acidobacteria bacterium]|nr:hypothetical protein [Acidobacteriota bacterium]
MLVAVILPIQSRPAAAAVTCDPPVIVGWYDTFGVRPVIPASNGPESAAGGTVCYGAPAYSQDCDHRFDTPLGWMEAEYPLASASDNGRFQWGVRLSEYSQGLHGGPGSSLIWYHDLWLNEVLDTWDHYGRPHPADYLYHGSKNSFTRMETGQRWHLYFKADGPTGWESFGDYYCIVGGP